MARKANREMWEDVISRQKVSGMPQIKWCQDNDVNIHNFRYWIGRLKKDSTQKSNEWAALVLPTSETTDTNVATSNNLKITIGNAHIEYNKNSCIEEFDKVVQVLMKYV